MSSINVSSRSFNAALQCSKFKYFANDFFHHVSFFATGSFNASFTNCYTDEFEIRHNLKTPGSSGRE
jgi:hypothetical protein